MGERGKECGVDREFGDAEGLVEFEPGENLRIVGNLGDGRKVFGGLERKAGLVEILLLLLLLLLLIILY